MVPARAMPLLLVHIWTEGSQKEMEQVKQYLRLGDMAGVAGGKIPSSGLRENVLVLPLRSKRAALQSFPGYHNSTKLF